LQPTSTVRNRWVLVLAIATLAAVCYLPLLDNGFINYDDDLYVTENPNVQQGLGAASLGWAFCSTYAANWHPLTWISHMVDWRLFGANAAGHHATSLVLHILNALLVFLVFDGMTNSPVKSAWVAALFAVHPLHVESVAWVAERKDVLSTLFFLLTLLFHGAWVRRRSSALLSAVFVCLAAGLCAKPMLVTTPFVLLILDWWPLRRKESPGRLVLEKSGLFALVFASALVTVVAQRAGHTVIPLSSYPLMPRLLDAPVFYVRYLIATLWPVYLAIFYPHPAALLPFWQIAGSITLLAGLTWAAWRARRNHPYALAGWLWYLGTLVPVIGIVQVGEQAVADRYTYIPLIGVFVLAGWGAPAALSAIGRGGLEPRTQRGILCAAGLGILLVLGICTRQQAGVWRDSRTVFEHAIRATGDNPLAQTNLGIALGKDGRLDEAVAHLREAVRLQPGDSVAELNLGTALAGLGRREEAAAHFSRSVELDPGSALAHANLGRTLAALGRPGEAVTHLERAVALDGGMDDARRLIQALRSRVRQAPRQEVGHGEPPSPPGDP
jgi:protein O-mannosyl-transferase